MSRLPRSLLALIPAVCLAIGLAQPATKPATFDNADPVRIGIYDSRAIALAWSASRFNDVGEKMKQLEEAKKTGDKKKIDELEAWGASHQRMLHFQGFGRVPVSDLLEPVREGMGNLVREKGLAAITMHCDAVAEGATTVDVTEDLVRLYEPPARTLQWIAQLKDHEPVSLVELADLPADR
jgi:hypothetical protein